MVARGAICSVCSTRPAPGSISQQEWFPFNGCAPNPKSLQADATHVLLPATTFHMLLCFCVAIEPHTNWSHHSCSKELVTQGPPTVPYTALLLLLLSHTPTGLTILIVWNESHRDLPGNHMLLLLFLPSLTPHSYNKILEEHAQK